MSIDHPERWLALAIASASLAMGKSAAAQAVASEARAGSFTLPSAGRLHYLERLRQAFFPTLKLKTITTEAVLEDVALFRTESDWSSASLPDFKIRLSGETLYPVMPCHSGYCPGLPPQNSMGLAVLYSMSPSAHIGLALSRRTTMAPLARGSSGTLFRAVLGGTW